MPCEDVKKLIILKCMIVAGALAEYWLGKRGKDDSLKASSGLELVLNVAKAIVASIICLVIIAMIRMNEWRNKK